MSRTIWFSSFGYPGPRPVAPIEAYVKKNSYDASYYWSTYPEATTTDILAALALRERFDRFARDAEGLSEPEFKAAYQQFLTDVQRYL